MVRVKAKVVTMESVKIMSKLEQPVCEPSAHYYATTISSDYFNF